MAGSLRYVWDELERAANVAAHGIDFTAAERFEWDTARVDPDLHRD